MEGSCPLWHPGECSGTPLCPPRCPRFVTRDGSPFTVHPVDGQGRRLEVYDEAGNEVGRSFAPVGAPAHVEVEGADGVAVELLRQAIAFAHVRGEDDFEVVAPTAAVERVADELGDVAAVDGSTLSVSLSTPAVSRLLLAPSRFAPVGSPARIEGLVNPASVALVGASDRPGSIGRVLLSNLLATFDGEVYPVHPTATELLGTATVDRLEALDPGSVDLTVIAVPADGVLDAVRSAIEVGSAAIAIVSAGFAEADAVGERRERELRSLLDGADVTVIGPNALGVVSSRCGVNASFAPEVPPAGGVSVVSHSGAMITAILDWLSAAEIGIRDVVSLGNTVDLDVPELLRFWGSDPDTEVVVAYLEDVKDGRAFVEAARDVSPTTPVIAIKGGQTAAGAAAASSHTGALVDDSSGFEAAFDAAGVIHVDGQQSLFDVLQCVDRQPVPHGRRVGIVTNAGGPGVLAADAVDVSECRLASFGEDTVDRLASVLPAAASPANPVDVLGDADIERIATALEVVLADAGVDAGLVTTTPHPLVDPVELVEAIGDVGRRYGKPVVCCLGGRGPSDEVSAAAREAGVAIYPDVGRAVAVLGTLAGYGRQRRRPRVTPAAIEVDRARVDAVVSGAAGATLGVEALSLVEAYGVSTPWWRVVRHEDDLVEAIDGRKGPFVLKVAGAAHKTEHDGVVTDVSADEAVTVFRELVSGDEVRDVVVQEQIDDGVEVLVGVTTHARFGPVVTLGLGGVFVEHLDDVRHALAPVTHAEVDHLLAELDASELVESGPRGGSPPDREALIDAVVRLSHLASEVDAIDELEVNPLIATPEGAYAVDLLLGLAR